jgi:hypothetical protein
MPSNLGSGQFSSAKTFKPHLIQGSGGVQGEIGNLRKDIKADFSANAAIAVEEFIDVPAAGAALISVAAASQVAAGRSATLLALAANIDPPRNITVTTAGSTPADAPATAVVTGKDVNGNALTETLTIAQTATIAVGAKAFASVTSIVEAAGDGTGATLAYGIGALIGLRKPIKTRAGVTAPVKEFAAGSAAPTAGTFASAAVGAPNGTYSPNTAANGTNDYCLYYEYSADLNKDS